MLPGAVHPVLGSALEWSGACVQRFTCLMKKNKQVEFSSHTGNLAPMRKFVRTFLDAYPFSERERMLMVLGIDEACTNVIRHAYHLRDDQLICLSLESTRHCIRMRLRDYGKQTEAHSMKG